VRRIAILDAPSNLGLRPPTATSVPGCAKAPGALRDQGLLTKLDARDAGCLTPPRYDPGDWRPGDGVAHARQIASYSRALADRIGAILDAGEFPLILGGDCSILLGSGLAMHRLGETVGGNIGLVFVDGHSDFRHPGNASYVGAAAGEDLALVTGRGQADLAAIEGRRPYFRDVDVVVMGIRAQDEYRLDLQAAGIVTRPVPALRAEGAARSAQWAKDQLTDCVGYWVHVDVDVLDPAVMPAVDAPSPGGIAFPELELLLAGLVESPHCLGVELTVFDPDYDTDGENAAEITSAVVAGLANAHTVSPRPDLIAARADLRDDEGAARADQRDDEARQRRRAEAAAESVSLAAGGASEGLAPEEVAVPATTIMGVELGDEVPAVDGETAEFRPRDGETAEFPHSEGETAEFRPRQGETAEFPPGDDPDADGTDDPDAEPADRWADADGDGEAEPTDHWSEADTADLHSDPDADEPDPAEPGSDADDDGPGEFTRRPLGSAPLLDSEPLPATRPGMLRPRSTEEPRPHGFSLPAQRPAFDVGSGEPADIA
jgi:arginase